MSKENEGKMREWVHSYSPLRIKQANAARKLLPKYMAKHEKSPIIKLSPIHDDRQVKRPVSAFLWFFKERVATGEYRGLPVTEISERVKAEWLNTSDSEKQVCIHQLSFNDLDMVLTIAIALLDQSRRGPTTIHYGIP